MVIYSCNYIFFSLIMNSFWYNNITRIAISGYFIFSICHCSCIIIIYAIINAINYGVVVTAQNIYRFKQKEKNQ